jgi:hypothetical protein
MELDVLNESLLSQLSDIDFRYWYARHVFLLARLCQRVSMRSLLYFSSVVTHI